MTIRFWVRKRLRGKGRPVPIRRPARPCLEILEDRLAPATLVVNSPFDDTNLDSFLTLREAVLLANAGGNAAAALGRDLTTAESSQISGMFGGNDTITFAPTFAGKKIELTQVGDNTFGPSALKVTGALTIDGTGETITRSGSTAFRLFYVTDSGDLTLDHLTLSNGLAQGQNGGSSSGGGGGGAGMGGAIFNQGVLSLTNGTLSGNQATGGSGGAVGGSGPGNGGGPNGGAEGGTHVVVDGFGRPYITGDEGGAGGFGGGGGAAGLGEFGDDGGGAGGFGGGGGGVSQNEGTGAGGGGGYGGGSGGTSFSSGGGAGGGGAGMGGAIFNEGGTVTLTNATLSGNSAQGGAGGSGGKFGSSGGGGRGLGGALFNYNGAVTLLNSTLAQNTVDFQGGAVFNIAITPQTVSGSAGATLSVYNSILAESTMPVTSSELVNEQIDGIAQVNSGVPSTTTNIVTSALNNRDAGLLNSTGFLTTDPDLGPLQDNGGLTFTQAPSRDSAAVNAGDNNAPGLASLSTDQRDLARIFAGRVDLGAVELEYATLGALSPREWTANQPYSGTVSVAGPAPFRLESVSGLPNGLTAALNGSTITISGTPTAAGNFNAITLRVMDNDGNTANRPFDLRINPAITLGTLSATQWTENMPGFRADIDVRNGTGPYTNLQVSGLPDGLNATLGAGRITINGTPTVSGAFPLVVSVEDSIGAGGSSTATLIIYPPLALSPLSPDRWTFKQSSYDGKIGVSGGTGDYHDLQVTGLPSGLTAALNGSTIAITGTPLRSGSFTIQASVRDGNDDSAQSSFTLTIDQATPTITWADPADITYGTPLGAGQLNATANVPGSFQYTLADGTTPADGVVLSAGLNQTLNVTFTPTDTTNYATVVVGTTIHVVQATPTLSWATPADITYGIPLSASQLNATANVPGSFTYSSAPDTVLDAGVQTLTVTFTPTDTTNFTATSGSVQLRVNQAPLTVTANDASRGYGVANPTFTARFTGFVNGETLASSGVTGILSLTTPATSSSSVGTYAITPSGLTASNYSLSFVNGTLTVESVATTTTTLALKVARSRITLTATVRGSVPGVQSPTGQVTFHFLTWNGCAWAPISVTAPLNENGVARLRLPHGQLGLSVGASYSGDINFAASSSGAPEVQIARMLPVLQWFHSLWLRLMHGGNCHAVLSQLAAARGR